MAVSFGGYGSFIWGVWYLYLGGIAVSFGGYGSFIFGVWLYHLRGI